MATRQTQGRPQCSGHNWVARRGGYFTQPSVLVFGESAEFSDHTGRCDIHTSASRGVNEVPDGAVQLTIPHPITPQARSLVAQLITKTPRVFVSLGSTLALRHRSLHVEGDTAVSRCIDDRWPQPRLASPDFERRMKQWMLHDMFITRTGEMVDHLLRSTPQFGPGYFLDEAEKTVTAADIGLLACEAPRSVSKRIAPWAGWVLDRIAAGHTGGTDAS